MPCLQLVQQQVEQQGIDKDNDSKHEKPETSSKIYQSNLHDGDVAIGHQPGQVWTRNKTSHSVVSTGHPPTTTNRNWCFRFRSCFAIKLYFSCSNYYDGLKQGIAFFKFSLLLVLIYLLSVVKLQYDVRCIVGASVKVITHECKCRGQRCFADAAAEDIFATDDAVQEPRTSMSCRNLGRRCYVDSAAEDVLQMPLSTIFCRSRGQQCHIPQDPLSTAMQMVYFGYCVIDCGFDCRLISSFEFLVSFWYGWEVTGEFSFLSLENEVKSNGTLPPACAPSAISSLDLSKYSKLANVILSNTNGHY